MLQKQSGDHGFTIGSRLTVLIEDRQEDKEVNRWNEFRSIVAQALDTQWYRMAATLRLELIAVVMHLHGVLDLGMHPMDDLLVAARLLNEMPRDEWPPEYQLLRAELDAISLEQSYAHPPAEIVDEPGHG